MRKPMIKVDGDTLYVTSFEGVAAGVAFLMSPESAWHYPDLTGVIFCWEFSGNECLQRPRRKRLEQQK
jgi:hypothetical protein